MSIQERLDELSPYVTTLRYGKLPIVETAFPKSWGVQEDDKIVVKPTDDSPQHLTKCVVYSEIETVSLDDVLDYVEKVIAANKEREAKKALLKEKVEELKILFNDNPLSVLKELYFGFTQYEPDPEELDLELELNPDPENNEEDTGDVEDAEPKVVEPETVTKTVGDQNIELPPKPTAPVLEDFSTPTCNCSQTGGSCPECTDL